MLDALGAQSTELLIGRPVIGDQCYRDLVFAAHAVEQAGDGRQFRRLAGEVQNQPTDTIAKGLQSTAGTDMPVIEDGDPIGYALDVAEQVR